MLGESPCIFPLVYIILPAKTILFGLPWEIVLHNIEYRYLYNIGRYILYNRCLRYTLFNHFV